MALLLPSPGTSGDFSISCGSCSGLPALLRHSPIWVPPLHGVPTEAVAPQSCPGLSVIQGVGTDPTVGYPPPDAALLLWGGVSGEAGGGSHRDVTLASRSPPSRALKVMAITDS